MLADTRKLTLALWEKAARIFCYAKTFFKDTAEIWKVQKTLGVYKNATKNHFWRWTYE